MNPKGIRKENPNIVDANSSNKITAKKLTPAQLDTGKKLLVDGLKDAFSSEDTIEKLWKTYLPVAETGDVRKLKRTKESRDLLRDAMTIYGLHNHVPLSETAEERYRPLVTEFSERLIAEYNCQTAGERALAEQAVSAHIRILVASRRLNGALAMESVPISREHTAFYSMLSKELDRANRQFDTALTTLIQLKSPYPNIQIKTNAAFVARAQQFNTEKTERNGSEEIITPT